MRRDSFHRDLRGGEPGGRYQHPAAALDADLDAMLKSLPSSVQIPDQIDAILQSVSQQQPLVVGRDLRLRRWSRLVLGAMAVGLSVVAILTATWLPEVSGHADANRPVAGVMRSSQQAASLGFGGLEALSIRLGLAAGTGSAQGADQPADQAGAWGTSGADSEVTISGALARSMLLPAAGLDRPLLLGHFEQDGGGLRLVIQSSEVLSPQVQTQVQFVSALAESAWDRAIRLTRGSVSVQVAAEPETFADLLAAAVDPAAQLSPHVSAAASMNAADIFGPALPAAGEGAVMPLPHPVIDAEGEANRSMNVHSLPPH